MRAVLTDVLDLVGVLALIVGAALGVGTIVAALTGTGLGVAVSLLVAGAALLGASWLVDHAAPSKRQRGAAQ